MTAKFPWTRPNGEAVTIEIEFTATYDPGNTYGPPESCSPPEGEIESMDFDHDDPEVKAEFEKAYNDDPEGTLQTRVDEACWAAYAAW
jgi:hypothetical protein